MPTIGTHIDEQWIEYIKRFCGKGKEYTSFSEYLRDLVRRDLVKRGYLKNNKKDGV